MDLLAVCLTFYAYTGLGEGVSMRPPPPGEEETQRLAKDRKRKTETLDADLDAPIVLEEAAKLQKQIEQKDALAEQLREEIVAKDAEILELKQCKDSTTLERETLRGEMIHPSFWRIVLMMRFFAEKAELEFTLSHLLRLYRPLHHRGLIILRRRSTRPFISSDEEDKDRGWMSQFVRVRIVDIIPKEFLPFTEKWNFKRISDFSEVRPSPFEEEEGPPISEAEKDNKRKRSSKNEDSHSKVGSVWGREEDIAADEDLIFIDRSGDINAPREDASILMDQIRRPPETVEPTGLEAHNLKGEIPQATSGSTLRGMGFDVSPPSRSASSGSTGADETKPVDAKSTFEEAQWICSMAFDKLKSELLCYEAKLHKALNGEKSLRLLCDKKTRELIHLRSELDRSRDYEGNLEKQRKTETLECLRDKAYQVNSECNNLKAQIDVHVAAKRNALSKASALEIQLRNAREGDSFQTSRIAKLEIDLLKMKAEVVDARAEAEEVREKADKKVAIYMKDAAEACTTLREASYRERKSNEYSRCKSRRETLEEIHDKDFDLSEEIEQSKADEFDAKFLVSNAEDNEEGAGDGASPDGANGDIVPEGGKAKFPMVD
ncbi:uncharacterized protein [Nicotiana sylvestris]|uniref:uncharacterized protein n=1 Tax=Nicotiana sylvestris TaxID=4096 RepID=UPI00388CD536